MLVGYSFQIPLYVSHFVEITNGAVIFCYIRDRPFNLKGWGGGGGLWFFVSFRIFFLDNTRVRILIFFV